MLKDCLKEGRAESGTITKELLEEVNEAKLGTGGSPPRRVWGMTSDAVVTVEITQVQFDVDRNFVFGIVLSYLDDKKSKRNG